MYGQRQLCFVQFLLRDSSVTEDGRWMKTVPLGEILIATYMSAFAGITTLARLRMTMQPASVFELEDEC
jgi:hypothetical protein